MFLDALANPDLDKFDLSTLRKGIAAKTCDTCSLPSRRLQLIWAQERTGARGDTLGERGRVSVSHPVLASSNRMGTSVDDGKARGKVWTRLPVPNLPLCHWSSQNGNVC